MVHRVLAQARVFASPLPSNELWIIIPNSKALKHTHWSFWFWTFSFWSLWRGTAIQCQSYPESVCTKSSSAQRQCQRVKAVLRSFALSKGHWKGWACPRTSTLHVRCHQATSNQRPRAGTGSHHNQRQVGFNNLPWSHHPPVPQLSRIPPAGTGTVCNSNTRALTGRQRAAGCQVSWLTYVHPGGRARHRSGKDSPASKFTFETLAVKSLVIQDSC